MKTRIFLMISAALILSISAFSGNYASGDKQVAQKGQISISSSDELSGLANDWVKAYNSEYPDALINLSVIDKTTQSEQKPGSLAFISGSDADPSSGWKMVVGREVIVPVMNASNPFIDAINAEGIAPGKLQRLMTESMASVWGDLLDNGSNHPLHLYILNDASVKERVMQFTGVEKFPGHVVLFDHVEDILVKMENDPYAIAFVSLSGIISKDEMNLPDKLMFLPLDRNSNGKLDYMENIYGDAETFLRGVWIGKYPKSLINEIYAVSSDLPADDPRVAFLTWVLTEGQQALALNGFNGLVFSEAQSKLEKFSEAEEIIPAAGAGASFARIAMIVAAVALLFGVMAGALFGFGRKRKDPVLTEAEVGGGSFDLRRISAPGGLFYDKSHTWAFMEKDGTVKVGIDDFLQHITGPITRIEMKKPGEKVTRGEVFLSLIQKGKQLNLYAPVTGTVLEFNRSLESNSFLLNKSPYGEGWVYRVEPASWLKEIPLLSMAGKYTKWLSDEFSRLKDFLASSLQSHKLEYSHVVLQDGGELKSNLLEDFGPEVWEDFQSKFIDTCR
jgi:glycine cleavage system H lipoate-binding protein/ABC-type phosphate transport system substrate-binding protein